MTFSFVLLKAPYYHLSRPSLSPSLALCDSLCFLLAAPTIGSNRSFPPLLLPVPFSFHLLARRLALFCSIIARLINYKGNRKSEKRSWHFRLQRERNPHTHTQSDTHTHTHTDGLTKKPNNGSLPFRGFLSKSILRRRILATLKTSLLRTHFTL